MIRRFVFIIALAVCVGTAWARDERSIKDLGKALAALAPDVDPGEADLLSVTAHTTSRSLAREYRIVLNPEFQNFLINIGNATGHDIEALGETVRARVKQHAGIELQWEIKRIGIEQI